MRRFLRRLIPSMFQRRLVMLVVLAIATSMVLAVQTASLTLKHGPQLLQKAESILVVKRATPTTRGLIRDRRGRVLAADRHTYDLAVDFDLLSGRWPQNAARREAIDRDRQQWLKLANNQKFQLIEAILPSYEKQAVRLWRDLCDMTGTDPQTLEQRRTRIVRRVERVAMSRWMSLMARRSKENGKPFSLHDVIHERVREQESVHVLIAGLDDEARFQIGRLLADARVSGEANIWQNVSIRFASHRERHNDTFHVPIDRSTLPGPLRHEDTIVVEVRGVGRRIVGSIREQLWAEDWKRPGVEPFYRKLSDGRTTINRAGYRTTDPIGTSGIERSLESTLRGTRGIATTYRDGRTDQFIAPVPGKAVDLAIDIRLQARVQAILDPGDPEVGHGGGLRLMRSQKWHRKPKDKPRTPADGEALCGAAVVLAVDTGEVLAAVSSPFARPDKTSDGHEAARRWETINRPWLNRAIAMPYPPGSTVKPLILCALYSDAKLGFNETLNCDPGHLYSEHPDRYRCWLFKGWGKTHGALDGPEAIRDSCNMFFYRAGLRLGAQRLRHWYGQFGLGRPMGSGLEKVIATLGAKGRSASEAALMAIGQGPIEWTVLQAANAYATLARGGVFMAPTFIKVPTPDRTLHSLDLELDPQGLDLALEGLRLAANDPHGTTAMLRLPNGREKTINIPDVAIFAKSGTAQAPDLRISSSDEEGTPTRLIVRQGDHAWVICLAQRRGSPHPDFVVAVIVEYGGSGGQVAGPIVNQILYALRSEEYL